MDREVRGVKQTISIKAPHLFRRAYGKGKSAATPTLVLYARKNGLSVNRLGLTVGTKVGKAHVRNRVRRRVKESYRLREHTVRPGYDLVIVARTAAADARFDLLDRHLASLLKRLELLV